MLQTKVSGIQILAFFLIFGYACAVPSYSDFLHLFPNTYHYQQHQEPKQQLQQYYQRVLSPIPLAPLEPFLDSLEPQASSHGYAYAWQQPQAQAQPQSAVNNLFYPFNRRYDSDTDFVPLEDQSHLQPRTESPNAEFPFEADVVSGSVGSGSFRPPETFFHESFPFFGQDFFNAFGLGSLPTPWYKGPNVCTDEKEETEKEEAAQTGIEEPDVTGGSDFDDVRPPLIKTFNFRVNSCVDKTNKHICTRITNRNGQKKTLTITRQCCRGYGRLQNGDQYTTCEKIDIKNLDEIAADMGAKEFVVSAKTSELYQMLDAKRKVTIFMPVDSVFAGYKDQLSNENNVVEPKEEDAMKSLFLRHIVDGEVSLYDVSNDEIVKTEQEGQTIRINAYKLPLRLGSERYTVNCVPIDRHDKLSEQGLVHTLNGVLRPVTKNVMDIIRQRSDMSIMRTVLENTKLSELLEGQKPVTIFVPTDNAFDKLEPHFRRALKEGKGCASNILKNHILSLTFCSAASVAGSRTSAYNLLGEMMQFNRSKVSTNKSETTDLLGDGRVVINGIAKIIDADMMGTNGVVHAIDTILPTEAALPLSMLMQEKNITIFPRLLEAADLDEEFDDMSNVTVFAPTDKALKNSKWSQLLNESPEILKNNAEFRDFLNYHVVTSMTKTCDLSEKLLPTVAGPNVRINLYSTNSPLTAFLNIMNRATVNCARLVHFDDESCGTVLHQVDKPLTPPKMNLLELLESNPSYSKFLELVRSANLSQLLTNLDEGYTLLVPKNDVFAEVEDWKSAQTNDETNLENLVKTHIIKDVVCCVGIVPTNWPMVRSIETLNGARLRINRDRRPKIENAGVTKCDVIAKNGIIHEINDIIVASRPQTPVPHQSFDGFGDIYF